ncbi:MAG: hypothetical protein M1608_04240, partial [Candidatus Omnitrophica bacterium]|nr:hypothetical protein [Candidatus Omnitrophota bacterium]
MITKFYHRSRLWLFLLGAGLAIQNGVLAQQRSTYGTGRSTSGGRSSSGSSTASYPPNGTFGDAMISSDPETRRIIVITDDETAKAIGQVITNLDKPKPQVLIKVVFLEVTYTDNSDIGLDASISRNINKSVTGSASNLFNAAALGANPLPVGAGGIYQIMGNDFQATLRAIAEAGKTELLSRPTILARNNQQAIIMVGQRIPLITGSQVIALTGGVNNTYNYYDVGIILRVTPFISNDGMVEMIVAPEISSLSDQGVTISTGSNASFNAPIINNRSAETVVVTPDGKTVIIGGLMENKKITSTRKVPLLGDIPFLGALFRRKVKQDAKSELYIFLTPRIVPYPSQVAAV